VSMPMPPHAVLLGATPEVREARCSRGALLLAGAVARGAAFHSPEPPLLSVGGRGPQQRRPLLPGLGGRVSRATHATHARDGVNALQTLAASPTPG